MSSPDLITVEAKIGEHCDQVTWVTSGIFTLSIFLSIFLSRLPLILRSLFLSTFLSFFLSIFRSVTSSKSMFI